MPVTLLRPRPESSWAGELWQTGAAAYEAILAHPFLAGLTAGTLPTEAFLYYLAQDAHYLDDYARALAVVSAKAPDRSTTRLLATHAAEAVAVELDLHLELAAALGHRPEELRSIGAGPTTTAYSHFVLAAAYTGDFAQGLAALLPCYWIYAVVGESLLAAGSPQPAYQRWIDSYAGETYAAGVAELLGIVDEHRPESAPAADRCRTTFAAGARYEWMFWDAAWRQETWPL